MQGEALSLKELLARAQGVSTSLRDATQGQPLEAATQSNVATFATVASMIDALSQAATRTHRDAERWRRALHRIANLEIRDAAVLLERKEWTRIAIELQAIAQEGISGLSSH